MKKLLLLFPLLLSGTLFAQSDIRLSHAPWIPYLDPLTVPQGMDYKGDLLAAAKWVDRAGLHYFLLSGAYDAATQTDEMSVYEYLWNDGKPELVWDIHDFGTPLCAVVFVQNSLQILDLDQDGLMETSFLYQISCDGDDPVKTKLMLHSKGQKLAIRGEIPRTAAHGQRVVMNVDPVVDAHPPVFRNFMVDEWDAFVLDGVMVHSKRVMLSSLDFLVMERYYMMASGGTNYRYYNTNGEPLQLPEKLVGSLEYAHEVGWLPSHDRLFVTSLPDLGTFNPRTGEFQRWMTLFPNTEAISQAAWAPSGKRMAFISLNREYPQMTKLFVLDFDDQYQLVRKEKFDIRAWAMAASVWVVDPPSFLSEDEIQYPEMGADPGEEPTMKVIRLEE